MDNFEQGLHKNDSNFVPLTPISFLERVKDVYPDYEAIIYKERKYTWKQIYNRCIRFASALSKVGVVKMSCRLWLPTRRRLLVIILYP